MKIAIFTDVFLEVPGGIPSSIKQEREALEKREDEVYIFCPGFRTEGERGVKIVPTNRFLYKEKPWNGNSSKTLCKYNPEPPYNRSNWAWRELTCMNGYYAACADKAHIGNFIRQFRCHRAYNLNMQTAATHDFSQHPLPPPKA